ncbi:MAG: sugar ABC transporter permease [Lachnospiraceae bacterium]|nr:sugar ABC transporter permease [Candidatus Merdinaster equi]
MSKDAKKIKIKRGKVVSYNKWGYIFLIPFLIVFLCCVIIPQVMTFYYSFCDYYKSGLKIVGPTWVGFKNYGDLFAPSAGGIIQFFKYLGNTLIMWIMGAVPQILIALLLAVFFTSYRLNIKGQRFFKTVIYMPNLIMASAFAMLFYNIFSNVGPVNQILNSMGIDTVDFLFITVSSRSLVALMNFLMWFGNSTLVLMSGIMGIDASLFEAASIDGASSLKVFFKVTLPLLKPILIYCVITAMIGGIQMYDVPQVLTAGNGSPNETSYTLMMWLQRFIGESKNYGMGGALSMVLFIVSVVLSLFVFRFLVKKKEG